jgi:hypothetical protein
VSRRRVRAVILVLGAFGIAAGCGKKGPPLPPLRPVPGPVANLTARRVDGHIELRFTIPAANIDRTSPAAVARVEIYARSAPAESPRPVKEQIVLRENLVATVAVKPPEPDTPKDEKKNEKDGSKPVESKPADPRPAAGDPASFVEPVPTAAPLPLPKLTGRAAQAAAAATRAGAAGPAGSGAAAGARGPAPGTVIPSRSPEGRAAGAPPGAGAVTPPPGAAGAPPGNATAAPPGAAGATPDKPAVKVPIPPTRYYWVQAVAPHGQTGPPGDLIAVPLAAVPPPPSAPVIDYDEKSLTMKWRAAEGQTFQVYEVDASGKEKDGHPLAASPLKTPEFTEPVVLGREVCLSVRSVTAVGAASVESDAVWTCTTTKDTFPPAAPTHLDGLPDAGAVSLRWDPVTAPDLDGYLVLRGEGASGTLQRLTLAPVAATSYLDTTVRVGVTYVYAVVAVDKSSPPNVSPQSNLYTVTIR